jgi:pSer/pThr/pTyr-binding forkhead associated (FHA) protein
LTAIACRDHGPLVVGVRLEVRQAGSAESATFEFEQDRIVIGRGVAADVRLPHATVSVRHASIRLDGARYVLIDHGSTNGTRIGDQALVAERPKALRDADVITIGAFRVSFTSGIVRDPTSRERTASLAKRLARMGLASIRATPARLVVLNGEKKGHVLELPEPPARFVIGRGDDTDLPLPDADASREHCEVIVDLDGAIVRDLASKNGVLVNDAKTSERRLRDRDELTIGATVVTYEDPADAVVASIDAASDEAMPAPVQPAPPPPEPDTEPAREPERPIAPPPRATLSRAEVLVAWLAAAVLLVSLSALYWLLR